MKNDIEKIVELALSEDIGQGDVSSVLIDNKIIEAEIICRDDAIICGVEFFNLCFLKNKTHPLNSHHEILW